MRKLLPLLICLLLAAGLAAQQDFRRPAAGMNITFSEIDELILVGTDGSDLVIEGAEGDKEEDDRARGLRKISATGLEDNTGKGLSVREVDGGLRVAQVGGNGRRVTVQVPNSASVTVEQSTHRGGDLLVSEFSGKLDVSMMYHKVRLEDVSGPVAVHAVYGDVIAALADPLTEEMRLHSTYGDVDLTVPAATGADVRFSTGYGDMYTDFDILVTSNPVAGNEGDAGYESPREVNLGQLSGTINGGGPLLSLTATYDNIYLRKQ